MLLDAAAFSEHTRQLFLADGRPSHILAPGCIRAIQVTGADIVLGATTQHWSMNAPTTSISLRYAWVACCTADGGSSPSRCHARHPSTVQRRMPGNSTWSFLARHLSRSSVGIVTVTAACKSGARWRGLCLALSGCSSRPATACRLVDTRKTPRRDGALSRCHHR